MHKLKSIDFITSLVAACLWLLGGIAIFSLVGFVSIRAASVLGPVPKGHPIYTIIGLFLYIGFVIGAWLSVKWTLPLFMKMTRQRNLPLTIHRFIIFSWLSIFSLLLTDIVAKDNLIVNFGFWGLVLASIYLLSKIKTLE